MPDPPRRSSRKRKLDDGQNAPAAMPAAEPSYAARLNVDAYVSHFDAAPKDTLDAWKTQIEKKAELINDIRALVNPGHNFTPDQQKQQMRGLLIPERRAALFPNLDMEIDWSHVDTGLNDEIISAHWAEAVALRVTKCLEAIDVVYQKLVETKTTLKGLCLFSNKTEVGTFATQTRQDEPMDENEYARLTRGVKMPSPTKSEELVDHSEEENGVWTSPWSQPSLDNSTERDLTKFAGVWNNMILEAEITEPLTRNSTDTEREDYKAEMLKTANRLQEWAKEVDPEAENSNFSFPNEFAGEKDAVQPILYSLLRVLSQIGTENHGRDDIRRERRHETGREGGTRRRYMDYEPLFLGSFVPILLSHHITMAVEAKNIARKNTNAQAMHEEVVKQLTGYMAKRLRVAFEVGNVGVDANATGVLSTPTYVQVLRLQLIGMGTEKVELKLLKTAMFPLVSLEAFNKIVVKEENRNYLLPLLFPPEATTEPAVPKGLKVLRALMHASEEDIGTSFFDDAEATAIFYPLVDPATAADFKEDDDSHKPRHLIGTGAHGTVYKSSTNDGTCIKASRVGETLYIERELKALKLLNAEKCKHIPKLAAAGKLKYSIRRVTAAVPAILISPLGISVLTYLDQEIREADAVTPQDIKKVRKKVAKKIKEDIEAALKFAHDVGVYHLDVGLDNIVFDEASSAFVLIDWANAVCNDEKVTGFRGSLAFAHAEIHTRNNDDQWSPKAEHDLASLGFTIAAFMDGHEVPWHGFSSRLKRNDHQCIHERRQKTSKILGTLDYGAAVDPVRKAVKNG